MPALLGRALLVGTATGLRSMTGLAVVALTTSTRAGSRWPGWLGSRLVSW